MSPLLRRKAKSGRRRGMHPLVITASRSSPRCSSPSTRSTRGCRSSTSSRSTRSSNNSVNVRSDSPVRIAGIDVGTVTGRLHADRARRRRSRSRCSSNGLPVHSDATRPDPRSPVPRGRLLPASSTPEARARRSSHDGVHDPAVANLDGRAVLQGPLDVRHRRPPEPRQHPQHLQPGLQPGSRPAAVRQRRGRLQGRDSAADAGVQGHRLHHARATRHAAGRRRAAALVELATSRRRSPARASQLARAGHRAQLRLERARLGGRRARPVGLGSRSDAPGGAGRRSARSTTRCRRWRGSGPRSTRR